MVAPLLIPGLLSIGGKLIDRLIPDPQEQAKAKLELIRMEQEGDLAGLIAQSEINKMEAQHKSVFVAGWRPFIGWTCGAGIAWTFVVQPLATFGIVAAGIDIPNIPALDVSVLMTLILGMLGIGGMRSFDKLKGTDTPKVGT